MKSAYTTHRMLAALHRAPSTFRFLHSEQEKLLLQKKIDNLKNIKRILAPCAKDPSQHSAYVQHALKLNSEIASLEKEHGIAQKIIFDVDQPNKTIAAPFKR